MNISAEMKKTIDYIKNNQNEIHRYAGGFWASKKEKMLPLYNGGKIDCYYPENYFRAGTIQALVKRNILEYTEFKMSKDGKEFPIKAILKKEN